MLKDAYIEDQRHALRIEQHHTGRLKIQVSELMDSAGSLREQIERLEQDRKGRPVSSVRRTRTSISLLSKIARSRCVWRRRSRKKLREHHEHLQEVRAKELELRQDFIELQKSCLKLGDWVWLLELLVSVRTSARRRWMR